MSAASPPSSCGWDDAVQRKLHAHAFRPGQWQVITAGGVDAGLLIVEYRPAEVYRPDQLRSPDRTDEKA
jgi:hypothetical protein